MPHPHDTEQSGLVINAVDNAVVPDSHPVQLFMSLKLTRATGRGAWRSPSRAMPMRRLMSRGRARNSLAA